MNNRRDQPCIANDAAIAEARSTVAALADTARTFHGSVEYERVLLHLDWIHSDDVPGLDTAGLSDDPSILFGAAESAIEGLLGFGADPLQIELVLAMLLAARAADEA